MTDTTPVSVSEPPQPAETVAPNDPWLARLTLIILGATILVVVTGSLWLADHAKEVPEWLATVAVAVAGGLINAYTTRTSASNQGGGFPGRFRRDRGDISLRDVLIVVGIIVGVLGIFFLWPRVFE
jgi:uncharacterized membrane-anchored protein YitT (DUF2179 family)